MMVSEHDYTTTNGIPIRAGERVVGQVVGDRFIKRLKCSRHMLREPKAWALDVQSVADAEQCGATAVEIYDTESGVTYSASIDRIRSKGFKFDRGFGLQICLPLQSWSTHRPGEPQQLVFAFGEAQ